MQLKTLPRDHHHPSSVRAHGDRRLRHPSFASNSRKSTQKSPLFTPKSPTSPPRAALSSGSSKPSTAVLTLPVEITSGIFAHTQDYISLGKRDIVNGPFAQAGVFKQWREIALGLNELWTGIRIEPSVCARSSDMPSTGIDDMLRLCLQRAGRRGLDLSLDAAFEPLFPVLVSSGAQCTILSLSASMDWT